MKQSTLLMLGIILAVVLVVPSALTFAGGVWTDLFDWATDFEDTDITDQPTDGTVGMGVIITFADGHEETIHPDTIQAPLLPLTVYHDGEEISQITWTVHSKATWTGTLTSLSYSLDWEVMEGDREQPRGTFSTSQAAGNVPSPVQGQWAQLSTVTVTAEDIDNYIQQGLTFISAYADVVLTFTFEDGTQDTRTATAHGEESLTVQPSGVTSSSVTVSSQPLS